MLDSNSATQELCQIATLQHNVLSDNNIKVVLQQYHNLSDNIMWCETGLSGNKVTALQVMLLANNTTTCYVSHYSTNITGRLLLHKTLQPILAVCLFVISDYTQKLL